MRARRQRQECASAGAAPLRLGGGLVSITVVSPGGASSSTLSELLRRPRKIRPRRRPGRRQREGLGRSQRDHLPARGPHIPPSRFCHRLTPPQCRRFWLAFPHAGYEQIKASTKEGSEWLSRPSVRPRTPAAAQRSARLQAGHETATRRQHPLLGGAVARDPKEPVLGRVRRSRTRPRASARRPRSARRRPRARDRSRRPLRRPRTALSPRGARSQMS